MANTSLSQIRTDRKIEQLKNEAEQGASKPRSTYRPVLMPAFVLAFMGLMVSLAGFGMPVAAATPDINLTWVGTMFASLVEAFNMLATPTQTLIETWFPVLIEIIVYGVIFGVIALIGYACRGVVMAFVKMIENAIK